MALDHDYDLLVHDETASNTIELDGHTIKITTNSHLIDDATSLVATALDYTWNEAVPEPHSEWQESCYYDTDDLDDLLEEGTATLNFMYHKNVPECPYDERYIEVEVEVIKYPVSVEEN